MIHRVQTPGTVDFFPSLGFSSPRRNASFDPLDICVSLGIPAEVRKSGSELREGLSSEVRETAVI